RVPDRDGPGSGRGARARRARRRSTGGLAPGHRRPQRNQDRVASERASEGRGDAVRDGHALLAREGGDGRGFAQPFPSGTFPWVVERDRLDLPPGLGRAGDGEGGAPPRGIRTRVHTLTTKTIAAAKHDQESLALAEELAMRSLVGPVPPRAGDCSPA